MTGKIFKHAVVLSAMMIVVVYLSYRVVFTIPDQWRWYAILFLIAEVHGFLGFVLFCFETWDPQYPAAEPVPDGLSVDIYICTYNEDPELLRKTILGSQTIEYPHTTYVCDDGHRESVKQLAEELGVEYISRPDNTHAKAGNINHALKVTHGDFIAILDADHVPLPDFLDRMLGYFSDPEVAFVQSPQTFYNLDAFEEVVDYDKGEHWDESEVFFHLILPGKNRWNSVYFCGTGGIIRRTALEESGGFATETITEDIHTALNMHAKGWKSVYVAEHMASGQAAGDLTSYHVQRTRWALGNQSVMFCSNPLFKAGLTLPQRICYFSSMFHWTIGLRKLVMYSTPLMMLIFNVYPISAITNTLIALYLAQLLAPIIAIRIITKKRARILAEETFSMLNFWVFTSAFIRAIFKLGSQKFDVTDKSGVTQFSMASIRTHLVFVVISVLSIWWAGLGIYYNIHGNLLGPLIAMFWCCWNAAFALRVIQMATAPVAQQKSTEFADHIPLLYRLPIVSDHPERLGLTIRYSETELTFVSYEPLNVGDQLDATLVLRFFRLPVKIEIISQPRLKQNGSTFAYTARYVGLDQMSLDMLNTHTMLYATPRLLDDLGQRGRLLLHSDSQSRPPAGRTRRVDFPINLDPDHNTWSHARVIQVDLNEAAVLTEAEMPVSGPQAFEMATPLGVVRGSLCVLSNHNVKFHGGPAWHSRIAFDHLDTPSQEIVKELACA